MKNNKFLKGRTAGVATDEGSMVRNGTRKTIDCGGMSDGGGSSELNNVAHAIYRKSVKNGGGSGAIGDQAIKDR